ncbi:alpha/beta hydrolase [Polyangium sp. y55x31]|uniref:alpha/beta hydrolase n=1 Tax=Polyangium sp. y55x31 TaxID=3042688 RepID=UPI002482FA82|nr:alpha/beta hydrolase [Polyangium sp. y55x31]MDI1483332.1 alpha/beta hydrolase [Polyangium sp. y55x31]
MLHPQARALIDFIERSGMPPAYTLSPVDARRVYRERRAFTQPDPPAVAEVRDLHADASHGRIPLRLYRPAGTTTGTVLPVLVYYHGGGWTIGDLDTHDTLCRSLANGAGCAVVSVDYRLGPEHRFPAAVDDSLAATYWVQRNAEALGIDGTRIAVGGDSAGGNLAAVVALAARDKGDLGITFQLLIYPATDMRRIAPSHTTNGQGYLLTRESITYYHDHYIDDPVHDLDWRASPLLHPSHENLPPALVLTAGFDPLRDEGLQYAERLTAAGSKASYVCFERQVHGFVTMGKVFDEANMAVALCAASLRAALFR